MNNKPLKEWRTKMGNRYVVKMDEESGNWVVFDKKLKHIVSVKTNKEAAIEFMDEVTRKPVTYTCQACGNVVKTSIDLFKHKYPCFDCTAYNWLATGSTMKGGELKGE